MSPGLLLAVAPLLALPLLPFVGGAGRHWLPALAALLPAGVWVAGEATTLPWVMLGAGIDREPPAVAAVVLLAPFFALALWPPRCQLAPGARACLLLGQGALGTALLASDLPLLLTGFTLATYALLAARLTVGGTAPGQVPAVIAVVVFGDLAAFELALLLAKAAANALVPPVSGVAGAVASSSFIAAFALLAAGSRGALLLLAGPRSGMTLPLAAFALLAVPALGWRLGGGSAALGAAVAVAAFALLAAALARLLSRGLPRWLSRLAMSGGLSLPGRRAAGEAGEEQDTEPGGLAAHLGTLELAIGSWAIALGASVVLVLLLLAATLR
jgi:hypothetical protein